MTTTQSNPTSTPTAPPDRLRISGVEVFAHHGVFATERRDGQIFLVDLDLVVDIAQAAASDDLSHTVDYGSLVTDVVAAVASEPVDLIETVAERIAGVCLARERVWAVDVTIHKPDAPIPATFSDVALTITRRRG